KNLPEWQRLDRIVNKARWIEAQTPPPLRSEEEEENPEDEEVVLPFRERDTDNPDPQQLDGFLRVTLSINGVLFVLSALFSVGRTRPCTLLLKAHDGVYVGSTALFSMTFWQVGTWTF